METQESILKNIILFIMAFPRHKSKPHRFSRDIQISPNLITQTLPIPTLISTPFLVVPDRMNRIYLGSKQIKKSCRSGPRVWDGNSAKKAFTRLSGFLNLKSD